MRRQPKIKWKRETSFTRKYRVRRRFPKFARAHFHGWAAYRRNQKRAKVSRLKKFFLRLLRQQERRQRHA